MAKTSLDGGSSLAGGLASYRGVDRVSVAPHHAALLEPKTRVDSVRWLDERYIG